MKIIYWIRNNLIPLFFKIFLRKFFLRKKIGKLNIDKQTYENIELTNIFRNEININSNVIGEFYINLRGKISIGAYSNINGPNTFLMADSNNPINIGKYCSIASNCTIISSNNHNYKKLSNTPGSIVDTLENLGGAINIGNDVWIGANSVILPGINIGNGAVVGAGSIVTKNVDPYSIVVGNPAKIIKYRFDKQLIKKVTDSNWWDWDIEKIKENYNLNNL